MQFQSGGSVATWIEAFSSSQLHLKSFADEYEPRGATESNLVQALADTSWRLNRVAALETKLLMPCGARVHAFRVDIRVDVRQFHHPTEPRPERAYSTPGVEERRRSADHT